MIIPDQNLKIKSRTSGFASPAESYVDRRLDLNNLICENLLATFYFRYAGTDAYGVTAGDILVIDREIDSKPGDLVVLIEETRFRIGKYENQTNLWGRISWILKKQV